MQGLVNSAATMPFEFEDWPGLDDVQTRVARGLHDVVVSGPSTVLFTIAPALPGVAQGDGSFRMPLYAAYWLGLGVTRPGEDIPAPTLAAMYLVHVSRVGAAVECCLADRPLEC